MAPEVLLLVFAAMFGLIVGSFLNVVIYRMPRGLSIVWPGSRCPHCEKPIAAYDNLPVLSWLLLRGRCRHCAEPISAVYPVVELATAVLTCVVVAHFGLRPALAPYLVMTYALIAITGIDLEHQIIPDLITFPGVTLFVLFAIVGEYVPALDWPIGVRGALFGVLAGLLVILGIIALYYLMTKQTGMGFGDVKFLAMAGALVGAKGVVLTLMLGAFSGTLFALPLMILGRVGRKTAIPFGPFLALGAFITMLYGESIIEAYQRTLGAPL
jgi:leader peptidase (prepilin peptidase) / N-methyltransferase